MERTTRRTQGLQRGPRSVQVVERVRAATLAELARAGFAGLTIDGVAKAANVSRTTIYRRWPTKAALLAAVAEPLLRRYDEDPDTGSLAGDLMALLTAIRDNSVLPEGRALAEAIKSSSAELQELLGAVLDRAIAPFRRALDRAAARGEVGQAEDLDVIAHLAFYGTAFWEQAHGAPPTDDDCRRMLRVLLSGHPAFPGTLPGALAEGPQGREPMPGT
jgi:AcrR family transcriptional regulator